MGSILCEHCTAACCRYVAVPLDPPRTARDYDDLRWYLMHEHILVFVEEGAWYIQFSTSCRHLGTDSNCTIYEIRPDICRDYEPGNCDYVGGTYGYDHLFTHPSHVEAFYMQRTGKKLRPLRGTGAAPRKQRRKQIAGAGTNGGQNGGLVKLGLAALTVPGTRK